MSSTSKKDASKPRRRFVGSKSSKPASSNSPSSALRNQVPAEILEDSELNAIIEQVLPKNYGFEIHKTIHHIRKNGSNMVALQMPEGLQMFACAIADIIERFTSALTTIMGDVTYGACCIDDYTAIALGCDMLVHYGHSCLVPSNFTQDIKTLYVFVEIGIDSVHVHQTIRANFPSDREAFRDALMSVGMGEGGEQEIKAGGRIPVAGPGLRIEAPPSPSKSSPSTEKDRDDEVDSSAPNPNPTKLALVSTIQFVAALQRLKEDLSIPYTSASSSSSALWTSPYEAMIPRSKPLSPGEILGCTAPKLGEEADAIVYLGDGRFHLEAIMIANPSIPAFRYDPYSKKLTRERYEHEEMRAVRSDAIVSARKSLGWIEAGSSSITLPPTVPQDDDVDDSPLWGVILGTLGRQGSFKQLQAIVNQLRQSRTPIPYMPILLSELSPSKLSLFNASSGRSPPPPSPTSSSLSLQQTYSKLPSTARPRISTFIQTSCPRLSIDWGYAFERPLLSPYECAVVLGTGKNTEWFNSVGPRVLEAAKERNGLDEGEKKKDVHYPMDFYTMGSPWALSRVNGVFA
ncbi:putative diphthamide synthesis protein-domain-containing protein [Rhodocollybia butyracea]|uniref:2-(3-amino-3-carboxypropyl)histidine synthase subunit 1 n=1 Tax=Rhodocollybia butyracea TaxID=206335 RepID=A0A9P5Q837_9AGAR|nr:putative diphthamide synthesis protein-domain-containing protein [Rhodocollybia butyracea]